MIHCHCLNSCDPCPRKLFDVESGFLLEICNRLWMNISAIFWKGRHCMAVPAATNCLLFENVLEKKSLSGVFLFFLKKNRSKEGILIYAISQPENIKPSLWLIPHTVCAPRGVRVCVSVCHWFVHHQRLFLFEDNSTCFHYTWLVLPQHRNQFSLTPHCRSHSKLQILCCQAAQLSIMWQS